MSGTGMNGTGARDDRGGRATGSSAGENNSETGADIGVNDCAAHIDMDGRGRVAGADADGSHSAAAEVGGSVRDAPPGIAASAVKLKARRYFSKPGFERLLREIWARYVSLERAGGHATVRRATHEECEAINDFFGWSKKPGSDMRVPLELFERELLESAFPYTIPELHEALTGKPLLTRSGLRLMNEREWHSLFHEARRRLASETGEPHPLVTKWLEGLEDGTASGYRILKELMRGSTDQNTSLRELVKAARAWQLLLAGEAASLAGLERGDAVRLPVLAALATGDAHALDRSEPAGRLLFQALAGSRWHDREAAQGEAPGEGEDGISAEKGRRTAAVGPEASQSVSLARDEAAAEDQEPDREKSAEPPEAGTLAARQIYRASGILDDDVSSIVHLYDRFGRWRAGTKLHVLTLRQIEEAIVLPEVDDIYMVENPSVFSAMMDADAGWASRERDNACVANTWLICTSGPASAAALRLLDRLQEAGSWRGSLFYAGDYDIKGIEIGNVIAERYSGRFVPWRFDIDNYAYGIRHAPFEAVPFTDVERARLEALRAAWEVGLTGFMARHGRKLFQEQLIAQLLQDWRNS